MLTQKLVGHLVKRVRLSTSGELVRWNLHPAMAPAQVQHAKDTIEKAIDLRPGALRSSFAAAGL